MCVAKLISTSNFGIFMATRYNALAPYGELWYTIDGCHS